MTDDLAGHETVAADPHDSVTDEAEADELDPFADEAEAERPDPLADEAEADEPQPRRDDDPLSPAAAAHAPGGTGASLARLALVVSAIVVLAVLDHAGAVLVVILALIVMVMVHELGHFVTAKVGGMKVTEYFLGFGPRLWSIRKGETEYGVKMIPAGGYVRIIGMTSEDEVDAEDEPRTYRQASFGRRLAVAVAGSTMHFVMALLLLLGLFSITGIPVENGAEIAGLYSFASGRTPAQIAGLQPGDILVSIDGQPVTSAESLVATVEDHPPRPLVLVVRRGGRTLQLRVNPVDGRHVKMKGSKTTIRPADGPPSGVLGVEVEPISVNQTTGFFNGIGRAGAMVGSLTVATGEEIAEVFSLHGLLSLGHDVATSTSSSNTGGSGSTGADSRPVSVVGVVQVASQAERQDVGNLLIILALVNIFIGMVNMFPMLPLDGGHVAIAVYERIRSRRGRRYFVDAQKMAPVAYLMLAFIVLIGLSTLYLDIVKPVHVGG